MSFYEQVRGEVLRHGAINNTYLARFSAGELTDYEFREFAVEFHSFARFFPRILAAQLVNTEDEAVADELTKVLYSELGDGRVKNRHELLYRDFLRSVGIDIHEAMTKPMLQSTRAYIEGMEQLYSSTNHATALGASFGLENMAITMWDHLIPGLTCLRMSRYPSMDMTYFTFHRELEQSHEEAMRNAVQAVDGAGGLAKLTPAEREGFRHGMLAVLGYLEAFWMGLEHRQACLAHAETDSPPMHGSREVSTRANVM